ncbi:MAG: septum formation initiator family protein [Verrucomicrobiales bacterium]|jgi:cell division protein FtsB|nr:septum formation initiator family protein [Verrucomicrobiales bacterium]|tara:strand:+ start:164 stop:487 length:324 start_codon:yes stop_codon:yes gene_type:complete
MSERRIDTGIWDKLTKAVVFLLVIAALLAVAVWYLPLIKQNERMRSEILRLQQNVATEEETARQIKVQIEALRNDPETVERYAREKLGLARPGETVIRFERPDSNAP